MEASTGSYCQATLNYSTELDVVPVEVLIRDGRLGAPGYEEGGFELLTHASGVADWRDEAHLTAVHAPEMERLALDFLGCDRALVYPPIVRSPATASRVEDYAPILFVHSDFTEDYRAMVCGEQRPYREFITPILAAAGLDQHELAQASRMVMLQFWRNIGARRPDHPLAYCDARTVPASQLRRIVVPEYGGRHLEFETFAVDAPASPDANEWYTFPELAIDEVVAFRTYDSLLADEHGHFWTPHSAFADPNAGPDAPRRESLEMRVLCLWGV